MQFVIRAVLTASLLTSAPAATAATPEPQPQPAAAAPPLFAIVYRAGPAWKPGVPMKEQGLRDHFYYVKALHERGDIVYAGAMGPDGGLMLIHAADQAMADAIATNDPAVKTGIFLADVRLYTPRFVGTGAAAAATP